jgi:hypothetical protein
VPGLVAPHHHLLDRTRVGGRGKQHTVQQEREVRLGHDLVVEQEIPKLETPVRIVDCIVEAEFLDQTAFAPAGPSAVVVRPHDVHLDLAAGVAAQPRAVLRQDHLRAIPRRAHSRTDSRHAAPRDEDVASQIHEGHVRFRSEVAVPGVRRRHRLELFRDQIAIWKWASAEFSGFDDQSAGVAFL